MPRPIEGEVVVDDNGSIVKSGYNTPGIKRVTEKHRKVGRLIVQGLSYKEISEVTGFSVTHITRIVATPTVRNEMERYRQKLSERGLNKLMASIPDAADVLIDDLSIKGNDPRLRKLRQTAAVQIIEKGMGGKKEEGGDTYNQQINVVNISTPDLMKEVLELVSE